MLDKHELIRKLEYASFNLCLSLEEELDPNTVESTCPERNLYMVLRSLRLSNLIILDSSEMEILLAIMRAAQKTVWGDAEGNSISDFIDKFLEEYDNVR